MKKVGVAWLHTGIAKTLYSHARSRSRGGCGMPGLGSNIPEITTIGYKGGRGMSQAVEWDMRQLVILQKLGEHLLIVSGCIRI